MWQGEVETRSGGDDDIRVGASGILGGAAIGLYAAAIRPRGLVWGARPDEVEADLPGDGLVSDADLVATRCIDIDALELLGAVPVGGTTGQAPYDFSWAFALRDDTAGGTRLTRGRYGYTRWWAPLLVEPVEAVSFLMTKKMLRGIRDRAEGMARAELVA